MFLANLVKEPERIDESIARSRHYEAAGADGFFLPGAFRDGDISAIIGGTSLPLNVMAWPGLVDAARLGKLGVRRLSAGAGISQVLWRHAEMMGREFLLTGRAEFVYSDFVRYSDLQNLFAQTEKSQPYVCE